MRQRSPVLVRGPVLARKRPRGRRRVSGARPGPGALWPFGPVGGPLYVVFVRIRCRRADEPDNGSTTQIRGGLVLVRSVRPVDSVSGNRAVEGGGLVFERFTDRARRVLVLAQEEARLLNHSFIGTEHLLLGLIHEGDGLAAKTLESLGISLEAVRAKVADTIGPAGVAPTGSPPFTPRAKKVLELALREALQLGHNYIGTEHILLGLVREGEGVAAQVLQSLDISLEAVRDTVEETIGPAGLATTESTIREFPGELWNATTPARVPPAAV